MVVENDSQIYYKYSDTISIDNSQQTMNMHIENADQISWLPNATYE